MYEIVIEVDGKEYVYGNYFDRNKANEVAMQIRAERNVEVGVYLIY